MKKKTNLGINIKNKLNNMAFRIPYIFILLLMIIIVPLGIYFFDIRAMKAKKRIYKKGRNLIAVGLCVLFLIGVGTYLKVKEILEFVSSGMSLDMINFMPDHIWLYILGIITVWFYIYGGRYLLKRAKEEQIYTYRINLEHRERLEEISEDLKISIPDVKENIKLLQKSGYLIPLEIDNKKNKIIYDNEKINSKIIIDKKNNKSIKCIRCGALIKYKTEEYLECDFCGHGMIDDDIK